MLLQTQSGGETMASAFAETDWAPDADISSAHWKGVAGVRADAGFYGEPVALGATEIRSRWTNGSLYLLYMCPYKALYMNASPNTAAETDKLWDRDVAEAFIGSDFEHIGRYKEFQVSPLSEFVDLDINRDDPKAALGEAWQSGFQVKARIDERNKVWYGEMRIPFASLGVAKPAAGRELRIGLFRIEGPEPNRIYVAWRKTGARSFHVPSAFGRLVLR